MDLNSIQLKYQSLFHRVKEMKTKSKADAIKAKCLECVNFRYKRITECTAPQCPLYEVRPYQKKDE